MKAPALFLAALVLAVAAVFLLSRRDGMAPPQVPVPPAAPAQASSPPVPALTDDLSAEMLDGYATPAQSPQEDLAQVAECIERFNNLLKNRDHIPTTGNSELVAALAGANNDRIRLLDPGAPYISEGGELLDRWQAPLFFHFQDEDTPEVRSAGPDGALWTSDDVLWVP